ncbi:MAG: shikimate kinase, partial [Clostridia bacterium]|nr:shikimate kinase [Clostridia bacterium]
SLGKRVAGNLQLPYIDMDKRLQECFGMTVVDIFAKHGEEAFRTSETNLLIEMTREPASVISTGGGSVMNPENVRIMKASGLLVLVDRPLDQILGDIKLDRRPTLAEKGLGEVERVYKERYDTYHGVADIILDNSKGFYPGVEELERIIRLRFGLYVI